MFPESELVNFFEGGRTRKRYFLAISQFKGVQHQTTLSPNHVSESRGQQTRRYCHLVTFPGGGDIVS